MPFVWGARNVLWPFGVSWDTSPALCLTLGKSVCAGNLETDRRMAALNYAFIALTFSLLGGLSP